MIDNDISGAKKADMSRCHCPRCGFNGEIVTRATEASKEELNLERGNIMTKREAKFFWAGMPSGVAITMLFLMFLGIILKHGSL